MPNVPTGNQSTKAHSSAANTRLATVMHHLFWQQDSVSPMILSPANHDEVLMLADYPIPRLPVLDAMVERIRTTFPDLDFSKVAIVAVQHNLETTVTLYHALQQLGVKKIFSLGKCYSDSPAIIAAMKALGIHVIPGSKPEKLGGYEQTNQHDIQTLWQTSLSEIEKTSIKTILVLDDGGRGLASVPPSVPLRYNIAGVEQTRGGLYLPKLACSLYPIVLLASSALKRLIEPTYIARAVLRKVEFLLQEHQLMDRQGKPREHAVIGVAGVGAIGAAIAKHLCSLGFQVIIYDKDDTMIKKAQIQGAQRVKSIQDLVMNTNCIFGCTGEDITQGLNLNTLIEHDTVLISCTSEDKEFKSALKATASASIVDIDPLSTFTARSQNGSKIIMVRGGFPGNFDNAPWNVPADEIEVTQAGLLGACFQAILLAKKAPTDGHTVSEPEAHILNVLIQKFIVNTRCQTGRAQAHERDLLLSVFSDDDIIRKESGMQYKSEEHPILSACFAEAVPTLRCRL